MRKRVPILSFSVHAQPERYVQPSTQRVGWCKYFLCAVLIIVFVNGFSQARLILNGATVNISQGAYLVIANSASNAITRNSGYIISEGENNYIKWTIGVTTGTYTVPWGYLSNYIPLSFTKTAGSGSGYFLFSTYHTGWQNSAQLPTGISNINGISGSDNSAFVSDRFWLINAQDYTTKPAFSNLTFTYLDTENTADNNTITESGLLARRYNSNLNSWTDNVLSSNTNTTDNTVTVTSVDVANLQPWWIVGTNGANRYWVAPSNSTSNAAANWSETAGGTGNAGVPAIIDAVIFDGSSDANCILDANLNANNLIVNPGYAGTITQGSNTVTLVKDATLSGGNYVAGTGSITVGNDFVISGTTFTAPSSTLQINGDFNINSGSFTHNNGTVVFGGTTAGVAQTITSATATTFNNISITNAAASPGVSIESNQNIRGTLSLSSNAVLDADGSSNTSVFRLLSTADNPTQDAAIGILPAGAQVNGSVTVQRYMSKEGISQGRIYRYIASPVQNATVADIQAEIPVTGSFTGTSACSRCSTSPSLFTYDETILYDNDGNNILDLHDGYVEYPNTSNTETFTPGLGYVLFVRANLLSTALWDVRGPINSGNVSPVNLPVSYTVSGTPTNDGWNLVGNPFPSTIDWNSSNGWSKQNLESTIYITDNGSAQAVQFATWNGVIGTNGGSRYIAMGQAFWVKANGNGAPLLQATEEVKASSQTTFFREGDLKNLLRVTLSKGAVRDETVIHFREDANETFDVHADARKFQNGTLNISSVMKDGKNLAINSLADFDCAATVDLNVGNVSPGSYKLNFAEFESFSDHVSITLIDNFADSIISIRSSNNYIFTITSNAASYGTNRFKINFSTPSVHQDFAVATADICEGSEAVVKLSNMQPGADYVATLNGQAMEVPNIGDSLEIALMFPIEGIVKGKNVLTVRSAFENCNAFVEKENTFHVAPINLPVVTSQQRCLEGSVHLAASNVEGSSFYNWYASKDAVTPIDDEHDSVYITPALTKSKTFYVSSVNALGCESERVPVKALIHYPSLVKIEYVGDSLHSSASVGNQWYYNGAEIAGASLPTIKPIHSGMYEVKVSEQGCLTSANFIFTAITTVDTTQSNLPIPSQPADSITVVTGNEKSEQNFIHVSPNPLRDEALIEISDFYKGIKEVMVMNTLGQPVHHVELNQKDGMKVGRIQLQNYSSGIYIVRVVTNQGVYETKVFKQ